MSQDSLPDLNMVARMKYAPKDHIKFRMLHPISAFLGEFPTKYASFTLKGYFSLPLIPA